MKYVYEIGSAEEKENALSRFKEISAVHHFDRDRFDKAYFEQFVSGGTFFGDTFLILCHDLLSDRETRSFIEGMEDAIVTSKHHVVFLEKKLVAASKKDRVNFFLISDALGKRDKKRLWVLVTQAMLQGVGAEEIYWRSFVWKVKAMLKDMRIQQKDDRAKLIEISRALVVLYHEARQGIQEFDVGLEKVILSL